VAKQAPGQSPADFLREQGWDGSIVLYGAPILRDGKQVERDVVMVVTAVGRDAVLGHTAEHRQEQMWTFDSREWYVNGQQPSGDGS
jgi:hypothetical protein